MREGGNLLPLLPSSPSSPRSPKSLQIHSGWDLKGNQCEGAGNLLLWRRLLLQTCCSGGHDQKEAEVRVGASSVKPVSFPLEKQSKYCFVQRERGNLSDHSRCMDAEWDRERLKFVVRAVFSPRKTLLLLLLSSLAAALSSQHTCLHTHEKTYTRVALH